MALFGAGKAIVGGGEVRSFKISHSSTVLVLELRQFA